LKRETECTDGEDRMRTACLGMDNLGDWNPFWQVTIKKKGVRKQKTWKGEEKFLFSI
jgi:hypothetical protein